MDLIDKMSDLENFGIDLKIEDYEGQEFYCETLRRWLEEEKGYHTYNSGDMEFLVEKEAVSLLTIFISEGILRFRTEEDNPYDVILDVLDFIAKHHKQTINVYNYLNKSGNSTRDWFDGKPLINTAKVEEDSEESEEESSEWL